MLWTFPCRGQVLHIVKFIPRYWILDVFVSAVCMWVFVFYLLLVWDKPMTLYSDFYVFSWMSVEFCFFFWFCLRQDDSMIYLHFPKLSKSLIPESVYDIPVQHVPGMTSLSSLAFWKPRGRRHLSGKSPFSLLSQHFVCLTPYPWHAGVLPPIVSSSGAGIPS